MIRRAFLRALSVIAGGAVLPWKAKAAAESLYVSTVGNPGDWTYGGPPMAVGWFRSENAPMRPEGCDVVAEFRAGGEQWGIYLVRPVSDVPRWLHEIPYQGDVEWASVHSINGDEWHLLIDPVRKTVTPTCLNVRLTFEHVDWFANYPPGAHGDLNEKINAAMAKLKFKPPLLPESHDA